MQYSIVKSTVVATGLAVMLSIHASEGAGSEETPTVKRFALTAKERLGSKAADNQRVNNCKVPPERRGSKMRPDACRWVNVLTADDRHSLLN